MAQSISAYRYPSDQECRIITDTWAMISDQNRFKRLGLTVFQQDLVDRPIRPVIDSTDAPLPPFESSLAPSFHPNSISASVVAAANARRTFRDSPHPHFANPPSNAPPVHFACILIPQQPPLQQEHLHQLFSPANVAHHIDAPAVINPYRHHTMVQKDPSALSADSESVNSSSSSSDATTSTTPQTQHNSSPPQPEQKGGYKHPLSGLTPAQVDQISPATQFIMQFYQNLIDSNPYMQGIFTDILKQSTMFSGLLGKMVREVHNLRDPSLASEVRKLGYRHRVVYRISDPMYDALGASLVRTVRHWLLADGSWAPEIDWAWMCVYSLLATWMKEGGAWEHTGPPSHQQPRRSGSVSAGLDAGGGGEDQRALEERYADMMRQKLGGGSTSGSGNSSLAASDEYGGSPRKKWYKSDHDRCVIS
ncbi:hypothetical protein BJ742DRAFT_475789 [Cladochytrium replicatum]|nr:hypothetical protein BJ742DRAFT_475789 [Cladochytrium replicatum]